MSRYDSEEEHLESERAKRRKKDELASKKKKRSSPTHIRIKFEGKDEIKSEKIKLEPSEPQRKTYRPESGESSTAPSSVVTDSGKATDANKSSELGDFEKEAARRRQRVAIWQEQRRAAQQAEEAEAKRKAEAAEKWTLDDDNDDSVPQMGVPNQFLEEGTGEIDPLDAYMEQNKKEVATVDDDEEEDALDAFMAAEITPAVRRDLSAASAHAETVSESTGIKKKVSVQKKRSRHYYSSESSSDDDEEAEEEDSDDDEWLKNVTSGKLSKSDKLGQVDHSTINYEPFRRNFYIEAQELQLMSEEQVSEYRKNLDNVKVRGKDVPKPVKTWTQCGLSGRILDVLKKSGFTDPMPIQAQSFPVIMSGRDCIGIATTGSGKTLAYVLPMLRHIKAQKPLERGDGPIGLILGPTRELVSQIGRDIRKFAKSENLTCATVYGGSGVADQITELKRGVEIIVCTPGRMIDVLVTSGGKITNLRRVTFLVVDEADRMFDMGFEPQLTRIVSNIRPDRQTVMFSATFPHSVEVMAKQILVSPVEIQVGGRSAVNKDITQFIEIRQPEERFMRLLEILGEWVDKGKILVFVNSQDLCDKLFRDLLQVSYACLSLHGGKDQIDRESTIHDFKTDVCNLLIATSVAARGLDVKDLIVVVNYDPPNHHEDYVHRVGRTGRAGNKGHAYTFICDDEERFAPDLVKALQESDAPVPNDLLKMAEGFNKKRKTGEAQAHGSGYGGSGFKFDTGEEEQRNALRKLAAREARKKAGIHDEDDDDDDLIFGISAAIRPTNANIASTDQSNLTPEARAALDKAKKVAEQLTKSTNVWTNHPQNALYLPNGELNPVIRAAQDAAQKLAAQHGVHSQQPQLPLQRPDVPFGMAFEAEIEINDFPQHARWKITHRDTIADLNEHTGAAVSIRGFYQAPGTTLPEGDRRIYLHIEGPSEQHVKECKREIKRILEESTEKSLRRDAPMTGRYTI